VAQAENFIHKLEHSYESPIAQEGANVSGGQKQRLSIARALVKQPPIYLFDDSFSALDFTTDAALRRALAPKTKNATVIIVAQRISTVINAQKIVVLDQGRIVGVGDHRELMRSCEVYQEIASSQLSPDELRHALTSPQHLKPKEGIA
jgi:ATP-binding cassette subfamily B protein